MIKFGCDNLLSCDALLIGVKRFFTISMNPNAFVYDMIRFTKRSIQYKTGKNNPFTQEFIKVKRSEENIRTHLKVENQLNLSYYAG